MARVAEAASDSEKILASFFSNNQKYDVRTARVTGMWLRGQG